MKKLLLGLLSCTILIGCGRQNLSNIMPETAIVNTMNFNSNSIQLLLKKNISGNIIRQSLRSNKILFQSGNNHELNTMDFNGKNKKQITHNNLNETFASFSPDGKYIAFI